MINHQTKMEPEQLNSKSFKGLQRRETSPVPDFFGIIGWM